MDVFHSLEAQIREPQIKLILYDFWKLFSRYLAAFFTCIFYRAKKFALKITLIKNRFCQLSAVLNFFHAEEKQHPAADVTEPVIGNKKSIFGISKNSLLTHLQWFLSGRSMADNEGISSSTMHLTAWIPS